jgi:hypothetical protein
MFCASSANLLAILNDDSFQTHWDPTFPKLQALAHPPSLRLSLPIRAPKWSKRTSQRYRCLAMVPAAKPSAATGKESYQLFAAIAIRF